jgi:hypothetical protein
MSRFRLRLLDRTIEMPVGGQLVVGRDPSCDIILDDSLASRRHATFRASSDALVIEDHQSLNGVRVNDDAIRGTRTLAHRDCVQIGSHVFVIVDTATAMPPVPTTKTPKAVTRRVDVAAPRTGGVLNSIAAALETGDLESAGRSMGPLATRFADPELPASPGDVEQAIELMLMLATRTSDTRWFARLFAVYTARGIVPDGAAMDNLQSALPRLGSDTLRAVEAHLSAMEPIAETLGMQDQVRLRRLASLARRMRAGSAP